MIQNKFLSLDDFAAPDAYAVPPTGEDLAYIMCFRQICKRYNIYFSEANTDEREFVIRMAEKAFIQNGLDPHSDPQ